MCGLQLHCPAPFFWQEFLACCRGRKPRWIGICIYTMSCHGPPIHVGWSPWMTNKAQCVHTEAVAPVPPPRRRAGLGNSRWVPPFRRGIRAAKERPTAPVDRGGARLLLLDPEGGAQAIFNGQLGARALPPHPLDRVLRPAAEVQHAEATFIRLIPAEEGGSPAGMGDAEVAECPPDRIQGRNWVNQHGTQGVLRGKRGWPSPARLALGSADFIGFLAGFSEVLMVDGVGFEPT